MKTLHRRDLLAGGAALAGSGLFTRYASAASAPRLPSWRTELRQLTPNVYAFIRGGGDGIDNASLSNAGLIVGRDSAMIVDALGPPIHAKEFQAAVRRTTDKPVTRIVNTHHHRDHTNGDYVWSPVEIVMTEPMRELVLAQGIPARPYDTRPEWQEGMSELRLAPPTTTITGETTYYYGETQVKLLLPEPSHTAGDIMVYLPREKVLFSGDVGFFYVTPALFAANASGWLRTIERIMAMDVEVIVPGHGPVGGKRELADMAEFLRLLINEIRRGYATGKSPAQAAADVDLGRFANWGNLERIPAAAVRLYAEWNGTLTRDTDAAAQAAAQAEYATIMSARRR